VGLDGPGLPYESENYAWFSSRYEKFLYVDRVVVDSGIFSQGLGQLFYKKFIEDSSGYSFLCAEVNLRPRNERSLRFHEKFGFEPVGEQDTNEGKKTVQMLEYKIS
jgi:predicted GNAT superfamily acetyltransferase